MKMIIIVLAFTVFACASRQEAPKQDLYSQYEFQPSTSRKENREVSVRPTLSKTKKKSDKRSRSLFKSKSSRRK